MSRSSMPRSQTLLTVDDVLRSTSWYSELLQLDPIGTTSEETHGNSYNRLMYDDQLVLQLHVWDEEGHPNMVDRDKGPLGHGILIWFDVSDFDAAVGRANALRAEVISKPSVNPNSGDREIWLRDPDGYTVVLSSAI